MPHVHLRVTLAIGLLLAGFAAAEVSAQSSGPSKAAEQSWRAGQEAMSSRQWVECVESFSDVVDLDPRYLDAYLHLGYCRSELKQWDAAASTYKKALTLNPPDSVEVDILNALAFVQVRAEDFEAALGSYEKLTQLRPNDKNVLSGYAFTLKNLNRPVESVMAYERALEADPRDVNLLRTLGELAEKYEMIEQAVAVYERWTRVDSTNVQPYRHLANLLARGVSCERGIPAFQRVIALDPSNPGDYLSLGLLYQKCEQFKEALDSLVKYQELRPEDTSMVDCRLASLYEDLGRVSEGIALVEDRVQKRPDDPCLMYQWGRLLEKQGITLERQERFDEAIATYRKAEARFQPTLGDPHWGERAGEQLDRLAKMIRIVEAKKRRADSEE
jgi:tetratricopeptide (TPR) repeat protein